jgi:hypothetical protein
MHFYEWTLAADQQIYVSRNIQFLLQIGIHDIECIHSTLLMKGREVM